MRDTLPIEQAPHGVPWKDLQAIPRYQFLVELLLPAPWLLISVILYSGPLWVLGPIASFFFFLCCLRLNHEAIHNNLGLRRSWDHVVMHGLGSGPIDHPLAA
ncbi:MAG: hypothetical protein ACKO2N_10415 [Tabrizicola sp.]